MMVAITVGNGDVSLLKKLARSDGDGNRSTLTIKSGDDFYKLTQAQRDAVISKMNSEQIKELFKSMTVEQQLNFIKDNAGSSKLAKLTVDLLAEEAPGGAVKLLDQEVLSALLNDRGVIAELAKPENVNQLDVVLRSTLSDNDLMSLLNNKSIQEKFKQEGGYLSNLTAQDKDDLVASLQSVLDGNPSLDEATKNKILAIKDKIANGQKLTLDDLVTLSLTSATNGLVQVLNALPPPALRAMLASASPEQLKGLASGLSMHSGMVLSQIHAVYANAGGRELNAVDIANVERLKSQLESLSNGTVSLTVAVNSSNLSPTERKQVQNLFANNVAWQVYNGLSDDEKKEFLKQAGRPVGEGQAIPTGEELFANQDSDFGAKNLKGITAMAAIPANGKNLSQNDALSNALFGIAGSLGLLQSCTAALSKNKEKDPALFLSEIVDKSFSGKGFLLTLLQNAAGDPETTDLGRYYSDRIANERELATSRKQSFNTFFQFYTSKLTENFSKAAGN